MKNKQMLIGLAALPLAACASHQSATKAEAPARTSYVALPRAGAVVSRETAQDALRNGEIVKTIYVGRHVDPRNPNRMIEAHQEYEIVQRGTWKTAPVLPTRVAAGPNVAQWGLTQETPAARDLEAEVARLRKINADLQMQAAKLSAAARGSSDETAQLRAAKDKLEAERNALQKRVATLRGATQTASQEEDE